MIHLTCYCLFQNKYGWDDFERWSEYDRDFDDAMEAVEYMDQICDNGERSLSFFVEVMP